MKQLQTWKRLLLTIGCSASLLSGSKAQDVHERINVADYVAKATNTTDQTEAIRQAIAAANDSRSWVLYFPPGSYAISDTIDIGGVSLIIGEMARIQQTTPGKDIFYASSWRKTVRGLTFFGGRDQIVMGNPNTDQGNFLISECSFNDAAGVAVRLYDPERNLTPFSSFVLVEKCTFVNCDQALVVASDGAYLRDCWISTKSKKNNRAVIENYDWLLCQNILGVPYVSFPDQRWIDNFKGAVRCENFRFGGEGSGFTPVVNYADQGSVVLYDCGVCALGNNRRACAVYLEKIPFEVIIRGGTRNVPAVKINPDLNLQTALDNIRGPVRFDVGDGTADVCAGALPRELVDAMAKRRHTVDYGAKQLTRAETKKALAAAVAAAKGIPSAKAPGIMTYDGVTNGHRQVTDPAKYVDITPKEHGFDLSDRLDGSTELNSEYLAMAPVGDDIALMSRMDEGSYPHLRIQHVTVDLDKTPFLSWRLKDNGLTNGSQAMKVINNATEDMCLLVEYVGPNQFDYYACDLRKAMGLQHGKVDLDLKFYLMGPRLTVDAKGNLAWNRIKKGEFFLIDFIRLEPEAQP